jgi:hypothetical protein
MALRMSEYQSYEFLAIDRPLDQDAQKALRSISSRARVTATSFTNHYEWGDLKGDPRKFMERWFDLHIYTANWGTRRLMLRLPARSVNRDEIDSLLGWNDNVEVWTSGDNLIVDIHGGEEGADDRVDEDPDWLAALVPLRSDILSGDLRLFYVLWLLAVQYERVPDDEVEPMPGIAPLTGALESLAEFLCVDSDLLEAAAELGANDTSLSKNELRQALAAIPESEKVELLLRAVDGDGHVGAELKNRFRRKIAVLEPCRTAGTLRLRAQEIAETRERQEAERSEAERRRQAAEAEKARRVRLDSLKRRGSAVWHQIETEIERRNPAGYESAMGLLRDLQVLAEEERSQDEFSRRIAAIRMRHEKKGRFIERLSKLGRDDADRLI